MEIYSPVKGKVKTLESLKDGVFSKEEMGKGFVVVPTDNTVCAPISGKLVTAFQTGHAFAIQGNDGTNVLVHVGLDTVSLNGEGFKTLVKQGKKIKAGKPMVEVDFAGIKGKVPSINVITVVTPDSTKAIGSIEAEGEVDTTTVVAITA